MSTRRCDRPRCRQPATWVVFLADVCDRHLASEIRHMFGASVSFKVSRMTVETIDAQKGGTP